MKIGILTLPLRNNYGGILQAYALQTALKRMGHDAYLVRLMPDKVTFRCRMQHWLKGRIKKLLGRDVRRLPSDQVDIELTRFINERIQPSTVPIHSMEKLTYLDCNEKFDAYVVGSDQVWRAEYARQFLPAYYCTFTKRNVRRIAYAASFGNSEWNVEKNLLPKLRKGISHFHKVMVREESGVALCRTWLGVEATVVLDPTMLLNRKDYLALLPKGSDTTRCGVFEYLLDRTELKENLSKRIQQKLGKAAFSLDLPDAVEATPLSDLIMHSIEDWIRSFECADYVVTDSFHGCVFSIIFGKPFFVIGNFRRGIDRFQTLLQKFGLQHCMYTSEGNEEMESFISAVSRYSTQEYLAEIAKNLDVFRDQNINYLRESLV